MLWIIVFASLLAAVDPWLTFLLLVPPLPSDRCPPGMH